ncbi:MAG: TolC family protein [Burkholderiaceae bacterium]|jgi:outer membrane protein TolC|nr:TolC family protein [Burkholderiaceae bacterium]
MRFPSSTLGPHRRRRVAPTLAALAFAFSSAFAFAAGNAPDAPASTEPVLGANVDELIEYARRNHPAFAAERAEAAAALERIVPAGALPDPTVGIELMDFGNAMRNRSASLVPGQVGETRYQISQPLPGWGKRELAMRAAQARAGQAAATRDAAWTEIVARIEAAWLRYYVAGREIALSRQGLTLLQTLEELSLKRFELGLVPQQAVLRTQREITAQRVALLEAEQRIRGLAAALNGLLARPSQAPLAAPTEAPPLPERLEAAALFDAARTRNPDVQTSTAGVEVARAERERTYQDRLPDFSVGLRNDRPYEGKSSWALMFEVMVPLQQASRRAREREAEYTISAAEARRADAEARAGGELGQVWSAFASNRDSLRLLERTLMPQAIATRDAARAALANGKVDFDSVIEAERQLIDIRTRALQAELDARLALVEIERITGAPK